VVDPHSADYHTVETNAVMDPPAPRAQPLVFGEGEGRQPAPEYPRQSVREGQEGVVVVRLSVDESGRVQFAEAVSPSPWALLNESAVHTVRDRWRFRAGPPRLYDVAIRFELTR
jgi:TonB family protein